MLAADGKVFSYITAYHKAISKAEQRLWFFLNKLLKLQLAHVFK